MTTPRAVRDHLVGALEADLIGPYAPPGPGGAASEEVLPLSPSRWYLTGFLAPQEGRVEDGDPTEEEQLAAGSDEETEEGAGEEPEPKQRHRLPASMGMSVLVPEPTRGEEIEATVTWADYLAEEGVPASGPKSPDESSGDGEPLPAKRRRGRPLWRRVPRPPVVLRVPLDPARLAKGLPIPESGGAVLFGNLKPASAPGLPAGTRALALFVVNRREPREKPLQDEAFMFQVGLEVRHPRGLVARPNRQGERSTDWDERVADLQFRDFVEYAVGHGASVEVPDLTAPVQVVRTTWLPSAEVRRVETQETPGVLTSMEALAALPDASALRQGLQPLVTAYEAWIAGQRAIEVDSDLRRDAQAQLTQKATVALSRIQAGLDLLERDTDVFLAFQLANRAMSMAALARNPERYDEQRRPSWRMFQLAFVLLNLRGLAEGSLQGASEAARFDRDTVELIFFPTGGGKTEAYLGVIAFTLVLRRLRGQHRPDGGLGVAVLLRYTLRLLTLDQLGRAATLMCALERVRQEQPERLGKVRFAVGLWVGKTATANTLKTVAKQITEYKASASPNAPSPFPLTTCPWCRSRLTRDSLTLAPNRTKPTEVIVGCTRYQCEFSAGRNPDGLPVAFVDEQVYRELPAFLIATVDKFAMLPWRGETGMLFGRATARRERRFFGPLDGRVRDAEQLPDGLLPPELIVQDELHLISGPLGTLVGLYEAAITTLCERRMGEGWAPPPKLIAATATVRRAQAQIGALFGREEIAVFPPQGVNDSETFFARVDRDSPGRRYVGVAASGRSMKAILLRAYVTLLAAAEHEHDRRKAPGDPAQPADPYLTLVGYFNSLRELGGMRRLVEDEVRSRTAKADQRRPVSAQGQHRWSKSRQIAYEPVELTSREKTADVALARQHLALSFGDKDEVDVLLASNMISVGIDIERLGLMVVAGQPKTTSEYIQATSRVGRNVKRPGLVITCFNVMKPRDRSHYERFAAYHEGFYRFVEATSVTPFSGPALDRGLAGTLLAITRLIEPRLTSPTASMDVEAHRALADLAVRAIAKRAGQLPGLDGPAKEALAQALSRRGRSLVDAWVRLVDTAREAATKRCYSPYDHDRTDKPMLYTVTDEDVPEQGTDDSRFAAPTSMRDVERTVHVWVEPRALGGNRG